MRATPAPASRGGSSRTVPRRVSVSRRAWSPRLPPGWSCPSAPIR
eukprot:bmy_18017T0